MDHQKAVLRCLRQAAQLREQAAQAWLTRTRDRLARRAILLERAAHAHEAALRAQRSAAYDAERGLI